MENRPAEAELLHVGRWTEGQMDRRDEANSRFSQLRKRA
jgi:hypothetical protein